MDAAAAVDGQHHFGLGVVPFGLRVDADGGAGPDAGQHGRFGEDFRVRPDPDFQVLRPHALFDQELLQAHSFGRAGADGAQVVADGGLDDLAHALGLDGVAGGLLFDHAFDHAGGKGYAGSLDHLQISRRQQEGACRFRRAGAVVEQVLDAAD